MAFQEGRQSALLTGWAIWVYGRIRHERVRAPLRRLILALEGGEYYSLTMREVFRRFHGVDVGLYTSGIFANVSRNFRAPATIGRYCSISPSARRFNMEHPMNIRSTHPFFYATDAGIVKRDVVENTTITIGNDVLIGHNAIILSSVERIGDGAIITDGAVVSINVPPYAIVSGYPARVMKHRFSPVTIQSLLEERWWVKSPDELKDTIDDFQSPLQEADSAHAVGRR
jgi:acetyltransferase-like isoleucine patch superfamily enzyme